MVIGLLEVVGAPPRTILFIGNTAYFGAASAVWVRQRLSIRNIARSLIPEYFTLQSWSPSGVRTPRLVYFKQLYASHQAKINLPPAVAPPPSPSPSPEFVALQIALAGEYSLIRELGRGGMGIVFLARDVQLDRDVAIKMLPHELANAGSRERFLREARMAAGLSHPNIVPIHRVGEASGLVYFVMSYVEGETLGERLRARGPLPPADTTRMLREVAWALAYAHRRDIVHRDIKPDNILLEAGTGRALVTDFGIAHTHAGAEYDELSLQSGSVTGTAHFMSPEQALGDAVDGRSDIYSLGVVGYLSLSARLPFNQSSLPALLAQQATKAAPAIASVVPGLSNALAGAIDRCLHRDPAGRFIDGEALATALEPTADTKPPLPATLRAWLTARNPLLMPYLGWSGLFSVLAVGNTVALLRHNPGSTIGDVAVLVTALTLPVFPILGFHLNQARRQFRAGHTLADLRTALEIAQRERAETEGALSRVEQEGAGHRALRAATIVSATWLAVTVGLLLAGVIHENRSNLAWIFSPVLSTMLLGAISNALDVQFLPNRVRNWFQTGVRDRLWNSSMGRWCASKLGAPERSRAVDGAVFRPTETALGLAASELFAALPETYRRELAELPATIAVLEAHAAAARSELEVVAALVRPDSAGAELLDQRRGAASSHLASSVAALERVRIDLLRLHAGAGDLAPLTTLIGDARLLSEDIRRLREAEAEVEAELQGRRSYAAGETRNRLGASANDLPAPDRHREELGRRLADPTEQATLSADGIKARQRLAP